MSKDNSVEAESAERKEFVQITVLLKGLHLYPGWEVVGDPFIDKEKEWITIRKLLSLSGTDNEVN